MPRYQYRVAHWVETFLIGLIVATGISIFIYRIKFNDTSKSNLLRMQRMFENNQTKSGLGNAEIDVLMNKLLKSKIERSYIQEQIEKEYAKCKTGECDEIEEEILKNLLTTFGSSAPTELEGKTLSSPME